jgi:hypothetical protein
VREKRRTIVSFISAEFLNHTSNNQINSWHLFFFFLLARAFRPSFDKRDGRDENITLNFQVRVLP